MEQMKGRSGRQGEKMMKTGQALLHCARWLKYCLDIGWSKSDVDHLEKLWWKYHDDGGRLKDVWD
jgi:hypothetical protein